MSSELTLETIDAAVLAAARVYLGVAEPASIREVVRNVADHLEVRNIALVRAAVLAAVAAGALDYNGQGMVSLPTGGDERASGGNR